MRPKCTIMELLLQNGTANSEAIFKDRTQPELETFFKICEINRVLHRVLRILHDADNQSIPREILEEKTAYCRKKFEHALNLIDRAQEELANSGAASLLIKTVDDFPDIGDIDILILLDDLAKAKTAMMKLNPDSTEKGSYGLEYSEKEHYNFYFGSIWLEIELYPRFTSQGESYISEAEIIERAHYESFDGVSIKVPSPEDRFLISVIHSMYRHGGLIRIIDVINTLELLSRQSLDWEYVVTKAKKAGVSTGLWLFLNIIEKSAAKYDIYITVPKRLKSDRFYFKYKADVIPFRTPAYLMMLTFCNKIAYDFFRLRWLNTVRLIRPGLIHLIGRALIFAANATGRTGILKKLGLELHRGDF